MKRIICAATVCMTLVATPPVFAAGVGFTRIVVADPMGGDMPVSIWYPTERADSVVRVGPFSFRARRDADPAGGKRALVVISHGSAGSDLGHRNVALALARSGFVVAAPLHPRDNFRDRSGAGEWIVLEGRSRQLSAVLDALLSDPKWRQNIDPKRVGAFGFSLGGYAVLAALGARPDISRPARHCKAAPRDPFCAFLGSAAGRSGRAISGSLFDRRICAAVIADPVAAPFSDAALAGIEARFIQIWRPEMQNVLMAEAHASRVARQLNSRGPSHKTEEIVVPGAQHYSFLAPFPESVSADLPRDLTEDAPGFNRRRFQARFAARISAFFNASLAQCGGQ